MAQHPVHVYNAQLDSLSLRGAPFGQRVSITLKGKGFLYPTPLTGAACRFSTSATQAAWSDPTSYVDRALTTLSATSATCQTPATSVARVWRCVDV